MVSSYTEEREYKRVHLAILLCLHIERTGALTLEDAYRITGYKYRSTLYNLLNDLDYVMSTYKEESTRYKLE